MFIDFLNAHWSYCEQCPLFSSVHNDSSGKKLLAFEIFQQFHQKFTLLFKLKPEFFF